MWPFNKRCKHIWKTTNMEYLDTIEHWDSVGGIVDVTLFKQYAKHQKCVLCGEKTVVKESKLA